MMPPEWGNCGFKSTPDHQPGYWGIDNPAHEGDTYMEMVVRGDSTWETITQVLSRPVSPDSFYYFTMYLAFHENIYEHGPCRMSVWGGRDSCQQEELLWVSPIISHNTWEGYIAEFEPSAAYTTLTLQAAYKETNVPHYGRIAIDDLKGLYAERAPSVGAARDTTLCEGESWTVDLSYPGATYLWQDGSTDAVYTISSPGFYNIKLEWRGIELEKTFRVAYEEAPFIELGNDTLLCDGDQIILDVTQEENGFYSWQDGNTFSFYEVRSEGKYIVRYVSQSGACIVVDTVFIDFQDCEHILDMPNVFSPNQDGINDILLPLKAQGTNEINWIIVDRWGREVYKTNQIDQGWDGRLNGTDMPSGIYYWLFTYKEPTGAKIEKSGNVLLVR